MANLITLLKKIRWRLTKSLFVKRTSPLDNFSYNRRLWNHYARYWDPGLYKVEDERIKSDTEKKHYLEFMGDEWGRKEDLHKIIEEFILSFVNQNSIVGEIGLGHGRVASRVAPKVKNLVGFDISRTFLKAARKKLASYANISFVLLKKNGFPEEFTNYFDFVYGFDVFVHLDLHSMRDWLLAIHQGLKPGGKFFVHTANLATEAGWQRFARQKKFSIEGHYFVVPQIIQVLATQTGFRIVKESTKDQNNFYKERDYLAVMEKIPA